MATETYVSTDLDLLKSLALGKLAPVADANDPTICWIAAVTPEGSGALSIRHANERVIGRGHGPGGAWFEQRLPDIVGVDDNPDAFSPGEGPMRRFAPALKGICFVRTGLVMDALIQAIAGQRVARDQTRRSLRELRRRFGEPAPGPGPDRHLLPGAATVAALTPADLHLAGIEQSRAVIMIECARRIGRLSEIVDMATGDADRRLQAVRGVGPWTSAVVRGLVCGDPDAVPVGDYHLPNLVAWNLAGEARADDRRMLELLKPWKGQRRRALFAIKLGGRPAPRFGARRAITFVADL
ncbi:DNA-3-methyladenine glycosylase [bacterium BMS3Bbin02]|nr:DNA-3-methyladenine glycosylase [bacterium BMS3Bbin02]